MEVQGQSGVYSPVVQILRRVTRTVQLLPFAYLFLYGAYMVLCPFASEEVLCFADSTLLVSPVAIGAMLLASRLLKLCKWHKIACLIPTGSQVEGYVDSYIFTFTQTEITIINITIGIVTFIYLTLAIRHFIYGR